MFKILIVSNTKDQVLILMQEMASQCVICTYIYSNIEQYYFDQVYSTTVTIKSWEFLSSTHVEERTASFNSLKVP